MEKQLTVVVPNASGEDGLTLACKRGELFRNDHAIDAYYREGYRIHDYSIVKVERSSTTASPQTQVRVILKK